MLDDLMLEFIIPDDYRGAWFVNRQPDTIFASRTFPLRRDMA
jgi:hypothetical protein